MGIRLAFPATKTNSVEITYISYKNLRHTFDKSPEKIHGRVLVPRPLGKGLRFPGLRLSIFFSETLHNNLLVARAKQLLDLPRVRRRQSDPARPYH